MVEFDSCIVNAGIEQEGKQRGELRLALVEVYGNRESTLRMV